MKKILKWAGISFLVLILILAALPFLFKGKIVKMIKEQANENLNAKINFGDFDLTLLSSFPDFKLSVDSVSVVNIAPFQGDTLFSVNNLSVTVNLMSVISGNQYKINSIYLQKPRIFAKVLKDGTANWSISKPTVSNTSQTNSSPSKFNMKLNKLQIEDGTIIYDDASLGFKMVIDGFNHKLSGDFTKDNFLLKTNSTIAQLTTIYGGIAYLNKVKAAADADIDVNMPDFKFTFKNDDIRLNDLELGCDGYFAMPKTDMDMDLVFSAKQSEFKNFLSLIPAIYSKDFASIKTSGKLALSGYVKGIYNDKKMPAFGAKINIDNAMFQYPSLPKAVTNIGVDVVIDNKTGIPDNTVIDVNKFHIEMAGNPVDMTMHVQTPVSDPDINGKISGKLDLSTVKEVIPLDKKDNLSGIITANVSLKGKMSAIQKQHYDQFSASGSFGVINMNYQTSSLPYIIQLNKMTLDFSPKYVALSAFDSKIGRSDIQADGKIENFMEYIFKKQVLKGEFNVRSSLLDLNQFMTPADSSVANNSKKADTTSLSVIAVPENVDFTMTATIEKMIYQNLTMSKLSGALVVNNQQIKMNNLKMSTLGGDMNVNGTYNTKNIKKPIVDFDLTITDFDISQTFQAFNTVQKLAPIGKYCTGKFSTSMNFTSTLQANMHPDLNSLTGGGKLSTKQVVVEGFEPINKLADALKDAKLKHLQMNNLNISFKFTNGRVYIDPFDYKVGDISGKIAGSNGFDQTIDYGMDIQMPRSELGGQANALVNNLVTQAANKGAKVNVGDKINLTVKFGGTVTKPTIKLDTKNAMNDAVDNLKQEAQQALDKAKAEAEAKAKAAADSLKNLALKQAQASADQAKKAAQDAVDKAKQQAEQQAKDAADKAKKDAEKKIKNMLGGH
ncbi:MAG: AsmA-like C-terminal region-containing protein [Bacteroidia bacterium]